jgi:hypothetical protein
MVTAVPAMSPSFPLSRIDTARPAILIDNEIHPPFAYVSHLETDDVLYVGRGYVAIHAARAGGKRLRLPQRRRLTQVLPVPADLGESDVFQFAMERFETRLFRISQLRAGSRYPRYGGSLGRADADRRLQLTTTIASPELS